MFVLFLVLLFFVTSPLAVGLTCFICAGMLKKSNDFGDSQGTVNDFSAGINIYLNEKSRRQFNRK